MSTIDPEAQRALNLRLAKGDISSDEYHRLLGILTINEGERQANSVTQKKPKDELLLQFEDLHIYSTYIVVGGKRKEHSDIIHIEGGSFALRMNLMPSVKHTHISIKFKDGNSFRKNEQRTLFGGERHKAIAQAVVLLKEITFKPCFDALVRDVRANPVKIGMESDAPIVSALSLAAKALSPWKPSPVFLRRDGSITNGALTFDLKQCRREGVLELGIYRSNLSEPYSVYACDKKSIIFEKSHGRALRFSAGAGHRSDVILALLNWMATPGNNL